MSKNDRAPRETDGSGDPEAPSIGEPQETVASGHPVASSGEAESVTIESRGAAESVRGVEKTGDLIGRYKLLQELGEGGFGTVWMAEQREPVKRRVALKIIKLGMDTRSVIARFEAERQALALMNHPNIAKVLDAGATDTGRPYFVMEYIKGVTILEYCDTERADTRKRLELFVQVCQAIQHAHQKGIIHRDVKPSNVLVTMHDGVPVPKVIDFGIAKATSSELTQKTLFTEHRQMIGTPAYMSPEQAEMTGLDIDTRSDIYSLGVLLYELLTGTTPFDSRELMSKGFAEMMRIIRQVEPHRPSTRLSELGETGTRTAEQRRAGDPKKLGLMLRGDLDWIVMKCLEKDRTRRYETVNGLAADIRRHLADEPVSAGPPTTGYRLRKFVRRNRGQVIAGAVVAATLVLGVVGTSIGMVRALSEKTRANSEAQRAERELKRAVEIKRMLGQMIMSVDPARARGADTKLLKGLLDDAAVRLAKGEIKDELVTAELRGVIGLVYMNLALYTDAEPHIAAAVEIRKRLLGEDNYETVSQLTNLAILRKRQGRSSEAEQVYLKVLDICRRLGGEEHQSTVNAMNNLATLYNNLGRYPESEALLNKALETQRRILGEEHLDTLATMGNLASVYIMQSRYALAESVFLKTLEVRRRVQGEDHPDSARAMAQMTDMYSLMGRHQDAEKYGEKTLEIRRHVLGEDHPDTIRILVTLVNVYARQGNHAKGEELARKALEISRRVQGEEHPDTLGSMRVLASMQFEQGHYEESEALGRTLVETDRRVLGDSHTETLNALVGLAFVYSATNRPAEAVALFEEALPKRRQAMGSKSYSTVSCIRGLADAYAKLGRRADALPLRRELLEAKLADAEAPDATATTINSAAWALLTNEMDELHDPARALQYARRACEKEEAAKGPDLYNLLDTLALAQHRAGDQAAALATAKRALSLLPASATEKMRNDYEAKVKEYGSAPAEVTRPSSAPGGE